jgi:hypothetical protein
MLSDRLRIAQIRLNQFYLAWLAERLQMDGEVGTTACDPDAPAVANQRPDDMSSNKAGSAEYCRQSFTHLIIVHHEPRIMNAGVA